MVGQVESIIEAYLCRKVREVPHARALKLQRLRGWPDRLVLIHGQVWFIECKRPHGGRFEPLQQRIGAWLVQQGYNYAVLNTKEGVNQWLLGL